MANIEKQNNDIDVQVGSAVNVWAKLEKIRELFAPNLTGPEFSFFVGLGKSLNANPFAREIWAVKYGSAPATIFLARDFYRKKAQEQADYDVHVSVSVFENDTFSYNIQTGMPEHQYSLKDRGALLGAYALAWKKGASRPFYKFVHIGEYNLNQSNWKTKPVTMIEKVAEAQILRMGWQGVYQGAYAEDEQPIIEASYRDAEKPAVIAPRQKIIEAAPVDEQTGEVLTLARETVDDRPVEEAQ